MKPEILRPENIGSLPGPDDILRTELPNGIVVLARSNFNSPSVVISGYLPAGGIFDPDPLLGLADFTASALMRGTASRSFREIYDALESAGASLGIGAATHTASFQGRALAEDLDLLLELLSEVFFRPAFPNEHIERLRDQMLTGLALRSQDTAEMASLAFDKIIYAGHPYERPEDGYPETVKAIRREDLLDFHRKHYGPRGMVLVIVGAVQPPAAVEKVAQFFGDWKNPAQPENPRLAPVVPLSTSVRENVVIPKKFQSDFMLGVAGPSRRSPDFLAASVGNNILGQFGMMGRIGEAVREKAGLAYHAFSSLSGGVGPGPWFVSAGVAPENIERAVDLSRAEIARFTSELVEEQELSDSQANFIGRLPLSLESNAGVAAALIQLEHYQLGLDYFRRYPGLVKSVTREDILETARRYLDPDRLGIAVAGPDAGPEE